MRVELTRLRWRRAILLLLAGCLVVPTLIALATIWDSRPVSESEVAEIRASAAGEVRQCVKHPRRFGVAQGDAADDADVVQERCEELVVGWYTGRRPLSLAAQRPSSGTGVIGVLTVLLMLAATTFVGHDWNSGSMSNQLLFRPRRGRVWAAKAIAVTGVSLLLAAAVSTAYWLVLWAVMRSRGQTVLDGSLTDSLLLGLRGAGFAAAAALGCYALTMLLRSTVATLGVLFAVAVGGVLFLGTFGISGQWQPHVNAAAVLQNGTTYYVQVPQRCYDQPRRGPVPEGSECDELRELEASDGVLYFGLALGAVGLASVLSFRRRDVP